MVKWYIRLFFRCRLWYLWVISVVLSCWCGPLEIGRRFCFVLARVRSVVVGSDIWYISCRHHGVGSAIFKSWCSIWDWILRVDVYIYMRHWMRRDAGSLDLKQGWVLLAGFVGCSWGIAFCWQYMGSSVGCWLFIYTSLLVRVLAPDRGYQACLFSMGSAPFGRCCDSVMQTIFNGAWCRLLSFKMRLSSWGELAGCSWGIAFYWNYVGSSVVVGLYAVLSVSCWCGFCGQVNLAWGWLRSAAVVGVYNIGRTPMVLPGISN